MNFNNLRLRSRTWLDVQSLTSFLVRVPPAAIAKWCLTNTTSKQRGGGLSSLSSPFCLPITDMIYKMNRNLEEI